MCHSCGGRNPDAKKLKQLLRSLMINSIYTSRFSVWIIVNFFPYICAFIGDNSAASQVVCVVIKDFRRFFDCYASAACNAMPAMQLTKPIIFVKVKKSLIENMKMPIQTSKKKEILEILKNLPPEKVDEIMDFAEYLEKKKEQPQRIKKKAAPLKLPTFHLGKINKQATERNRLYGEYLDRKFA